MKLDNSTLRLNLICKGYKRKPEDPIIILDTEIGEPSYEWSLVTNQLMNYTRVCTYNRAGYSSSYSGKYPRTSDQISSELKSLLISSDELPPFLLVGHGFGAFNVRLFAVKQFNFSFVPLLSGIVFVDGDNPSTPQLMTQNGYPDYLQDHNHKTSHCDIYRSVDPVK